MIAFHKALEAAARKILADALTACPGNKTKAAKSLGVNRTHFYSLLHRYDVPFVRDTKYGHRGNWGDLASA